MQQDNRYLIDILHAAQRIQEYTAESTLTDFYDDVKVQDKVMRRLLAIGKAARQISTTTRESMQAIAWSDISTIKEQLLKDDPCVDVDQLWNITQTDIPLLIQALKRLVLAKNCGDLVPVGASY